MSIKLFTLTLAASALLAGDALAQDDHKNTRRSHKAEDLIKKDSIAAPGDPIPGIEIVTEQEVPNDNKRQNALDPDSDNDSIRDVKMNEGELTDAVATNGSPLFPSQNETCNDMDNDCSGPDGTSAMRSGYMKLPGIEGESEDKSIQQNAWDGTYKGKTSSTLTHSESERCFSDGQEVACPGVDPSGNTKREVRKFKKMEKLEPVVTTLEPIEEVDPCPTLPCTP